jgi:DNA-binding MarR family transcriptional regulator
MVGAVDRLLVRLLDPVLRQRGLSRQAWRLLVLLADGQGRSMGELARGAGLTNTTATRLVDALIADLLVHRRSDPADRRRVLIHLAAPGRALLDGIEREVAGGVCEATGTLTEDDRAALAQLLTRVVADAPPRSAAVAGPIPTVVPVTDPEG